MIRAMRAADAAGVSLVETQIATMSKSGASGPVTFEAASKMPGVTPAPAKKKKVK